MVLTADDFAFFVTENGLDPNLVLMAPPVRCCWGGAFRFFCLVFLRHHQGTIYFAIQLLEFGGDHLDQLMDPSLIRNDK